MCKTFSDGLHSLSRLRHDRCKQKYLNKNFAIVRQPTLPTDVSKQSRIVFTIFHIAATRIWPRLHWRWVADDVSLDGTYS